MTLTLKTNDFNAFFDAPFNGYGPDSPYISPLKPDLKRFVSATENPLFQGQSEITYFTAHRDGRPIGRITAHIHAESNQMHGLARGYFGYFDCADDAEAATALLTAAEDWARARGCTEMAGNFNLTAMQQIGVCTDGFENPPYTDQIWSPPHIARLLGENGYAPTFPMATFHAAIQGMPAPPMGPKQQAILDDPRFTFAPMTRSTINARMEDARIVLNASFADNPMFVPLTAQEVQFQAKDMKWIMDPRISAVLHRDGKPVACIVCIPDVNPFLSATRSRIGLLTPFQFLKHKFTCRRAIVIFAGVLPELQGMGVNPLLMSKIFTAAQDAGYETIANTWIGDENGASLAQREKAGATALHRLHLFGKTL
jgi:GNAT superfamily N-acetyltransferase